MSGRTAARLAWAIAGICGAALVNAAILLLLVRRADVDVEVLPLGVGAALLGFPVVGALAAARRPGDPVGWIMLWVGLEASLWTFSFFYAAYGVRVRELPVTGAAEWWAGVNWPAGSAIVGIVLLALLFPAGRPPSARWRPVVWAVVAITVLVTVHDFFAPGRLPLSFTQHDNPLGSDVVDRLSAADWVVALTSLAVALAAGASLVVRVRDARGDERAQLKWFVSAIAIAAAAAGYRLDRLAHRRLRRPDVARRSPACSRSGACHSPSASPSCASASTRSTRSCGGASSTPRSQPSCSAPTWGCCC